MTERELQRGLEIINLDTKRVFIDYLDQKSNFFADIDKQNSIDDCISLESEKQDVDLL